MPQELGTSPSTRAAVRLVMVGFTDAGMVNVSVQVLLPIFVLPLYVAQVIVQVPVTAFGIWLARETGGVHETEVDEVFVTIVPVALPNV